VRTLTDANWGAEVEAPTLILLVDGREADRRLGFASAAELREWLQRREAVPAVGTC